MASPTRPLFSDILQLLEALDHCADGERMLPLIEHLLHAAELDQDARETHYRELIRALLDAFDSSEQDAESRAQLALAKRVAAQRVEPEALNFLLKELLDNYCHLPVPANAPQPAEAPRQPPPEPSTEAAETDPAEEQPSTERRQVVNNVHPLYPLPEPEVAEQEPDVAAPLDQQADELAALKLEMLENLDLAHSRCSDYEALLGRMLKDLRQARKMEDLEKLRKALKKAVKTKLREHSELSRTIGGMIEKIHRFDSHCQSLSRELGRVKQLSMTDELTRLPNRRAFMQRLCNESARVQRYNYPLAIGIIDLDLFKEVNDEYGHEVGDEVLRVYTRDVLSTFRNYDMVARYGGEEFAVLLPQTDLKGAVAALNKVRTRAELMQVPNIENVVNLPLPTLSAGVAMYRPGEAVEATIKRADQAMYTSKRLGRNRVSAETN